MRPSTKNRTLDDILKAIPASQVARIELIRTARPGLDQKGAQLLANVVRITAASSVHAFTLSNYTYTDGTTRPAFRAETSRRGIAGGWEASLLLSRNQDESGNGERVKRRPSGEVLERARISVDSPIRGAEARMAADLPLAGGTTRGNLSLTHQDYRTHEAIAFVDGGMSGLHARTDDRIRTNSGEIGGEWSRAFGSLNTKLLMLATRKDIAVRSASDDGGTPSDYVSDSVADERILRATADRTPERGAAWEISSELAYNALESRSALSIAGAPVALPGGNVTITEWRGDASALVKIPVFNRLSAEMMIRGDPASTSLYRSGPARGGRAVANARGDCRRLSRHRRCVLAGDRRASDRDGAGRRPARATRENRKGSVAGLIATDDRETFKSA